MSEGNQPKNRSERRAQARARKGAKVSAPKAFFSRGQVVKAGRTR